MMARSMKNLASALVLWAAVVLRFGRPQPTRRIKRPDAAPTYAERQDKINAWTVGLAAGPSKVPRCGWPRRWPAWSMTGTIFTSCRSSRAVPRRT